METKNNLKRFKGMLADDFGIKSICPDCNSVLKLKDNVSDINMPELKGMVWKECETCKMIYMFPGDYFDDKD